MRRPTPRHGPHLLRFEASTPPRLLVPRSHCPPRSGWHSPRTSRAKLLLAGIGNYQPLRRQARFDQAADQRAAMLPPPMMPAFLILFIEISRTGTSPRLESLHSAREVLRASAPGSLSRDQARLLWRRSQDRDPKSAVRFEPALHLGRWRTRNPHSFPSDSVIELQRRHSSPRARS